MLDKFKREINYLRISVTDRCNLRCTYCMPAEGIYKKDHKAIISYEEIIKVVESAVKIGITKIRLTGGEPLVRKDIISLVKGIRSIPGVRELVMTTNGVLLDKMAVELKSAGLDRVNISLDTLDPVKYKELVRTGDISAVMNGIEAAVKSGFTGTKINMVLIPGFNDDEIEKMKKFCIDKGLHLQRINHYSLQDINSINRKYEAERPLKCSVCNRIRLTSDGKLKPCLFSDIEISLDPDDPEKSLEKAVLSKPASGSLNTTKGNWEIGG
ncbi:MAG: radical SAM protein [Acidobacteriota bacterium]